ncbi:PREDICTED: uncharacterized protein LOC108575242 [Habropoda laboriosa]|uniref:uncharacterized protein LOC108575242 n=1 Tax=Habropoda laboriosa TaxID=597456 RepID=UPI00083CC4D2|nr:PREDICTED: uncharacterized protein LOC108575242 [Habropoda laboriosa]
MNNIRIITLKLLRTYGTKTMSENAGVRRKREVTKYSKDFETDFEELDHDDIGIYESDFTEVAKFYEEKKRARKADHEQLKRLIVKSKYFKEVEPSFLTYVEKEQIKKLHKTNPDEWTPQKLSESFPALPETIKKILKASWVPKSVDTILKYDKKVIQNWKNWKTGQLAVNFNLKEHLMKFKNRTISLTDRETLVNKFVAPKMEFPKPTSSFFSSIVQSVDKKQVINNEQLKSSEKSLNKGEKYSNATEKKELEIVRKETNNIMYKKYDVKKEHNHKQETLVFDEFIKKKLNNPSDTSPEERLALLNTYKKHVECKNLEDVSFNVLNSTAKYTNVQEKDIGIVKNLSSESSTIVKKNRIESKVATEMNAEHVSLDTFVKDRSSYMDTDVNYIKRLKIPKNSYKKGMTYRVNDCYYDDDGEFLYRIPGMRS